MNGFFEVGDFDMCGRFWFIFLSFLGAEELNSIAFLQLGAALTSIAYDICLNFHLNCLVLSCL